MIISVFSHWKDNVPAQADVSFDELCSEIFLGGVQPTTATDKTQTLAFSPVEYAHGTTRGNENVIAVYAAVLDYDGLTLPQTIAALESLQGLKRVIYSTYSHGKKSRSASSASISSHHNATTETEVSLLAANFSFRVVLPLSKPVPGSEWSNFWAKLQSRLAVPSDKSCKDPARIYGLPYTPAEDLDLSFYEAHDGAELPTEDIDALPLPITAQGLTQAKAQLTSDLLDFKQVRAHGRSLQRSKYSEKAQLGSWVVDVANGDVWTRTQGQRHQTMLQITAEIERKFSMTSIDALTQLWERSITAVNDDPSWDPNQRLEDIRRAYEGARAKRLEETARRDAERQAAKTKQIAEARGDGSDQPYSEGELARLREFAGLAPGSDLTRFWVLQYRGAYYVLHLNGYAGPYRETEVMTKARDLLAPAGIATTEYTDKGKEVAISLRNFLQTYSTPMDHLVVDMLAPYSYVDEENVFHEACCKLREIKPQFDPLVDEYLTQLGGKHEGKLKDWLATFTDVSRQTCALYLKGAPGTGKTLIAEMLASMYVTKPAPTPLDAMLGSFNGDYTACPLIFGDEDTDTKNSLGQLSSGMLRKLIGSNKRKLSRKFTPNAELFGAPRLILSANHDKMLRFQKEEPTANDLDAINERFLCIEIGDDVAAWIGENGGRDLTSQWVAGAFESHVMWLKENRAVVPGKRWLVAGEASEVQNLTATGSDINSGVCQWIAKYFEDSRQVEQIRPGGVFVDEHGVWVNSRTVLETWENVVRHSNARPNSDNVGNALAALSWKDTCERTVKIGPRKTRARFRRIKAELVRDWAIRTSIGDAELLNVLATDPAGYCAQQQALAN